jgi:hypothetical protein
MKAVLLLVFLFSALTIWALFKVVSPFLEDREDQLRFELLDEELGQIEELVARKSVLLQTLRDIEFDHETGKLDDADYERLRAKHEKRAVDVMRRLQELRGDEDLDEEIDSEIEQRLQSRVDPEPETSEPTDKQPDVAEDAESADSLEPIACPACERELAADASFCSGCGIELLDECPDCGRDLDPDARFCDGCGLELYEANQPDQIAAR